MAKSLQDQFTLWKNRIDAGEDCLKNQKEDWEKYEEAYEGEILDTKNSDYKDHHQQVNLFYVDVRSFVPKVYSRNPYIYVDPEVPEADLNAEIMEKVLNAQLDKAWHLKQRIRSLVKGTKIQGRGYLKTSFKFKDDKIGRQYIGEEPNDEISIQYVPRDKLIVDPNAGSFKNRRWAAHIVEAPIQDIRKKFKINKDQKITVVEDHKDANDRRHLSEEEREDFKFGRYFEIENVEDHTLAIIVEGLDSWAVKPYEMPYGYHSMYDDLEWNDIPGCLDTKADLHFWYNDLYELAEIKTQKSNHRRKLNAKYKKIGGSNLTEDQIDDVTSYIDSTVVELDAGQDIIPFQHAPMGQEVYLYDQSLRQDITVVSGMNEMKQGLPQVQKTAREAMAIVAEATDVISDRVGLIEDLVASVMNKCIWLIQKYYDTTKVIRLTGMEEAEFLGFKDKFQNKVQGTANRPFMKFVGTELIGKMSVTIKAGSTRPVDEDQRKADLTQLIQLMGQSQQVAAAVDSKELLKEITKVLHFENKGIILDAKSPEQENVLLKRNIPVMPHMNEPHDQHIAAHDMENNNTPAFIAHRLNHILMKSFIERSQVSAPVGPAPNAGASGPGGLSQENISGMPMGSSVPPEAMPTQPEGAVSAPQQASPAQPDFS